SGTVAATAATASRRRGARTPETSPWNPSLLPTSLPGTPFWAGPNGSWVGCCVGRWSGEGGEDLGDRGVAGHQLLDGEHGRCVGEPDDPADPAPSRVHRDRP